MIIAKGNYLYVGKKSLKKLYYRLLSEFMLQQTQVNTVIPYFNKFRKKFKTLKSLSNSNEKEIENVRALVIIGE